MDSHAIRNRVLYIVTSTHLLSMHTEFFSLSSIFLSINMFWTWTWLMLVTLGCLIYLLKKKSNNNSTNLPPGPKGLPILGNLLMLGKFPHRDLQRLANQYGSIMHLQLGFVPTIVVSSPRAAELFVKVNDLNFSSRPLTETAKSYSSKGLSFTEYGPFWRNIRKLCTLHLLSSHKIESFKSMRRRELELLVESLKEAARTRVFVDLSTKIWSLSMDMSCLMILGKKYMKNDDDQIKFLSNLQEGMQLAAAPNMADYIPYIGALDLQGLGKRLKVVSKVFDDLFEKIIDEHIIEADQGQHRGDFVDVMLSLMNSKDSEFQITRANIKAIMLDMLAGSMDTSSTAIEWAFAELLRDPRAMKKVQQEIESVVGMDREVEEADLVKFQYLDMVVKESLRLHPVAPFLIPHESMEDCTVSGYHIPAKSRIMVNAWAIGRDPTVWPEPDKFFPERFIGSNIDLRGRDFELLPFGSGRRGCPGMQLGLTIVRLVVAQLAHCFDWELPNGMLPSELNMEEDFGLTIPRANHLSVTPMYRLTTPPGS